MNGVRLTPVQVHDCSQSDTCCPGAVNTDPIHAPSTSSLRQHTHTTLKQQEDNEHADEQCSICMQDFTPSDEIPKLPYCRHRFHRHCIKKWVTEQNSCPLCRRFARAYQEWKQEHQDGWIAAERQIAQLLRELSNERSEDDQVVILGMVLNLVQEYVQERLSYLDESNIIYNTASSEQLQGDQETSAVEEAIRLIKELEDVKESTSRWLGKIGRILKWNLLNPEEPDSMDNALVSEIKIAALWKQKMDKATAEKEVTNIAELSAQTIWEAVKELLSGAEEQIKEIDRIVMRGRTDSG